MTSAPTADNQASGRVGPYRLVGANCSAPVAGKVWCTSLSLLSGTRLVQHPASPPPTSGYCGQLARCTASRLCKKVGVARDFSVYLITLLSILYPWLFVILSPLALLSLYS